MTSKKAFVTLLLLAGSIATAGGLSRLTRKETTPSTRLSRQAVSLLPMPSDPVPQLAYGVSVGDRLTYEVSLSQQVTTHSPHLPVTLSGSTDSQYHTAGIVQIDVLDSTQQEFMWNIHYELVTKEQGNTPSALLRVHATGRYLGIDIPPDLSPSSRIALKQVLSFLQVSLPEAPRTSWEAEEMGTSGPQVARYWLEDSSKSRSTVISKQVDDPEGSYTEGLTRINFDRERGLVTSVQSNLQISARDDRVGLSFQGTFEGVSRLIRYERGGRSDLDPNLARDWKDLRISEEVRPHEPVKLSVPNEAIYEIMAKLQSTAVDDSEAAGLFGQLKDWLKSGEDRADTLLSYLLRGEIPPPWISTVICALGAADTLYCQHVLLKLLELPLDQAPWKGIVLVSLGQVSNPIPEVEKAIQAIVEADLESPISSPALMTLGIFSRALRTAEESRSQKLASFLESQLERTADDFTKGNVIHAIGNTGHPNALPSVQAYKGNRSDELREAAAAALGRFELPQAREDLLHLATSDSSEVVRRTALRGLARTAGPEVHALMEYVAQQDSSPMVRSEAVQYLGDRAYFQRDESAYQLLQKISVTDADAEVRSSAQRTLESIVTSN